MIEVLKKKKSTVTNKKERREYIGIIRNWRIIMAPDCSSSSSMQQSPWSAPHGSFLSWRCAF
jgi:hypothetical protein